LEGPWTPLKRAFNPKAVAILLEAFDALVAELDLRTSADKERAAKIVIPAAVVSPRRRGQLSRLRMRAPA
jgi:hypothetical protein